MRTTRSRWAGGATFHFVTDGFDVPSLPLSTSAPSPASSWPAARERERPWPGGPDSRPSPSPGDHGGLLGDEYGQTNEPDAFVATLREVLTT